MTRVLVTGGAGYIGSHTCKALVAAGFEPVTLDNLTRGHREFVRWGPLEVGSLENYPGLCQVFDRHRPEAVLHFAAYAYVGESTQDPAIYYRNNVGGTLNLLDAMRLFGVNKLVFSSTCATYGIPSRVPIPVTHPQSPINPYGRSKKMVETILNDYRTAFGLRSYSLRYFNAAGADVDGELGERHYPETHAVPLGILTALGQRAAFEIFGTDYDTEDGTAVRDYIHVTDLASAHVAALQRLVDGADGDSVNLGTGHGTSVKQLIEAIEHVSGRSVPVVAMARREGDPPALVADGQAALDLLNWYPKYDCIEDIVSTALAWHERELSRK